MTFLPDQKEKLSLYKSTVVQFSIHHNGEMIVLSRAEALELYQYLAKELNVPAFEYKGCGERYSHPAHAWGKEDKFYCGGLAFDRT